MSDKRHMACNKDICRINLMPVDKRLLFICTGNYYRSRFAEMLFNAQAAKLGLGWKADSRGFEPSIYNIGPVHPSVLQKLETLGVSSPANPRMPMQLTRRDLESADLVIALNAAEHIPLMSRRFTKWVDKIAYWNIPDLDLMRQEDAFSLIEENITSLVGQLQRK